jgi:hypothetical protein
MIKKLYYIVELELQHVDGEIQETTGIKYVRVYDMINNVPNKFCNLEIDITDNTEIEIQEYLDDNGHGDEIFELIEL